jgi:hypothetical protein
MTYIILLLGKIKEDLSWTQKDVIAVCAFLTRLKIMKKTKPFILKTQFIKRPKITRMKE